ncbi:MAG: 50S ribosomal protein L13 [Deltaproteobacteria bacterium]|nr:50S ribosomal protein L13 [Deltaproteobacteria bacterium]
MKTFMPKPDEIEKKWHVVDAAGKTLGKLAIRVAAVLRGKHKPTFSQSVDTGDFVVVVNAEKISVTGKKLVDKVYYHHSTYPHGLKARTLGKVLEEKPEEVVKMAVWGMLPKGRLGRDVFKKLKVYAGSSHPHEAQTPSEMNI